jgi:hypothetical protein
MKELFEKLEAAVLRRNPSLAQNLQPGLPVETIKKDLKQAGITGAIERIVDLYSWRNGTLLQGSSPTFKAGFEAGFVPPIVRPLNEGQKAFLLQMGIKRETEKVAYHFIPLKKAIIDLKAFSSGAQKQPRWSVLVGRYLPLLWDGSSGSIALDIDSSAGGRIVKIETQQTKDEEILREAYDSFEGFLKDCIRANENNELLACLQNGKTPVGER